MDPDVRRKAYLALKALTNLKPARVFAENCKDSSGSLSEFYEKILTYADRAEQARLVKELASLKLKTIVLGGDTKASHSGLRIYFAKDRADGTYTVQKRLLDLRLLHKCDHQSIFGQIADALALRMLPNSRSTAHPISC